MNTSEGSVEGELANGNFHPLATEIPEAKDALAVGDDDDLDAPLRPVLEHLQDLGCTK